MRICLIPGSTWGPAASNLHPHFRQVVLKPYRVPDDCLPKFGLSFSSCSSQTRKPTSCMTMGLRSRSWKGDHCKSGGKTPHRI
eukprot:584672-Amphidinium_carterae.1